MQNNKLLPISIIIFALGMFLSSIYFGYSIQKGSNIQVENAAVNSSVMNISEVANYLGMTEEEVQGIINTEKNMLESRGSYTGIMFPYFIVNDKLYFYKEQIDEWLKDTSIQRKEYDTKKLIVF
ncbi:DNA-binding protein [Clostridium sp. C8]|uniref:DNA-binding protein n=1 Tax=Clostridium sp. C8 TaxID=1667357 RepID=UPI00069BA65B|nr:DNA-binding protein [Clostridium sp. C8]